MLRQIKGMIPVLMLGTLLAGCAGGLDSIFNKEEKIIEVPADKLYNEGLQLMEGGSFTNAAKKFEEVDRQHPYSELARKAMVMQTYANFRGSKYDDAINSAKRFLTLHPGSPDAPYVQYLMAQSYYQDIPDVARDQGRADKALDAYEELVRKWPSSEYVTDARRKIEITRDQLAGREMVVGRYYLQQRNYIGGINRFKTVVTRYQTTRHVEEALLRLTEAYYALGVTSEAQTAAAVLGHNFPNSQWYQDAYKLLSSGGLEPREDTGSWISRAMKKVGLQ